MRHLLTIAVLLIAPAIAHADEVIERDAPTKDVA